MEVPTTLKVRIETQMPAGLEAGGNLLYGFFDRQRNIFYACQSREEMLSYRQILNSRLPSSPEIESISNFIDL